jgi:Tol biopolymer transport system component
VRYQSARDLLVDLKRLKRDTDSGREASVVTGLPETKTSVQARFSWRLVGVLAALAIALTGFGVWRHYQRRTEPVQRERALTTNSSEASVTATAISADGKYLAYACEEGVYLKSIETGELHHIVSSPKDLKILGLFWFPDGTKVFAIGFTPGGFPSLWVVSTVGGTFRKLRDNVCSASVSPDGGRVAFGSCMNPVQEMSVMSSSGEDLRKIVAGTSKEFLRVEGWSPNCEGFLFLRRKLHKDLHTFTMGNLGDLTLEIQGLKDTRPRVVLSDLHLSGGGVVLPDGRYIYPRWAAPDRNDWHSNLWEVRVDFTAGRTTSEPRQITHGTDVDTDSLSASADGKRLVFLKSSTQTDVYIGSLEGNGKWLRNTKRLTFDDRNDYPAGWMPDSKAVLFTSDRNGNFDIFKQTIGERTAEALVAGPKDECDPTATADGAWLFYFLAPSWKRQASSAPNDLMRIPLAGGPTELVLSEPGLSKVQCSGARAYKCAVDQRRQGEVSFYAFDPVRGKGQRLGRIDVDPAPAEFSWALSKDGSRIAVVMISSQDNRIRVLSLETGAAQTIVVKGWNWFQSIGWAADGGWHVLSNSKEGTMRLHVDPKGSVQVLGPGPWGAVSPDGQKLAFPKETTVANAWMIENF